MQLASITFDGEKKNSRHYIIPASYFKKKGITPIPVTPPKKEQNSSVASNLKEENREPQLSSSNSSGTFQVKEPPKIILKKETKRASGLSLSSIRAKKEHLIKQMDVVIEEEDLPKEAFTEKELIDVWNTFIEIIRGKGKHNLASILSIDTPKVKETTVYLEFPNATNKVEVERNQYDLLSYVRKSLNNYDISLSISINDVMEKKYAYTPADKFEKLKEKNSNIELLRKTFDLDI